MLVRLVTKIAGKKSIYKIHNKFLNKKFEKVSYQIPLDTRADNQVI
jgi:hypothetical protein